MVWEDREKRAARAIPLRQEEIDDSFPAASSSSYTLDHDDAEEESLPAVLHHNHLHTGRDIHLHNGHGHGHSHEVERERDQWLWPRQCVPCDDEPPECNCAADENCVLTGR